MEMTPEQWEEYLVRSYAIWTYRSHAAGYTTAFIGERAVDRKKSAIFREMVAEAVNTPPNEEYCPGCAARPGDGINENCNHPLGCGFWREYAPEPEDDTEDIVDRTEREWKEDQLAAKGKGTPVKKDNELPADDTAPSILSKDDCINGLGWWLHRYRNNLRNDWGFTSNQILFKEGEKLHEIITAIAALADERDKEQEGHQKKELGRKVLNHVRDLSESRSIREGLLGRSIGEALRGIKPEDVPGAALLIAQDIESVLNDLKKVANPKG